MTHDKDEVMLANDTVAVIVHFRNYASIAETLTSLVNQGLPAERILVVDTSDEPHRRAQLRAVTPPGAEIIFIENKGYGNAVNEGVRYWSNSSPEPEFILIATHEVKWWPNSLNLLRSSLQDAHQTAAAGPTLITGEAPYSIWSKGSLLTEFLGLPRHYGHKDDYRPDLLKKRIPEYRDWLDGSCVLYRFNSIEKNPIDETYFLYMEETDLHLRLGKLGFKIIWVPGAVAWQSSLGIPSTYSAKNLRLLYTRSGRQRLGRVAVPLDVGRQILSAVRKGQLCGDLPALLRGLIVKLPRKTSSQTLTVRVVNPLGAALKHYADELVSVLEAAGTTTSLHSFNEPSASGRSRVSWILEYSRALKQSRISNAIASNEVLIVTWPVLGHLDLAIISTVYRRAAWLVVHDPKPLVRARGYSKASVWIGKCFSRRIRLVAHSDVALSVMVAQGISHPVLLPHPILPPAKKSRSVSRNAIPQVLVIGQYKPDRDLQVLKMLGERMSGRFRLDIFGRGWPEISGWKVTPGFLPEHEIDLRISDASVVLIPYSRFFQSGIAIRAIEAGIPIVGPRASSLTALLGADSPCLADSEGPNQGQSWDNAILFAIGEGQTTALSAGTALREAAVESWQTWATSVVQRSTNSRIGQGPRGQVFMESKRRTLVTMGGNPKADEDWKQSGLVTDVLRLRRPSKSGFRLGSRILGLGIDSFAVSLICLGRNGAFLANSPWIAAALRLTGKRNVAVIGTYAGRDTASFRVLRKVLGPWPVVTMAEVEARDWRAAGGRSVSAQYGNDLGYPPRKSSDLECLEIFVGGTSDRDSNLLGCLISEIQASSSPCNLVIASGDAPRKWSNGISTISHTGYVSSKTFGELISQADVIFLPIKQSQRAAGHMVMVGALESGVAVLSNDSIGMNGYIDGTFVVGANLNLALLPQLSALAVRHNLGGTEVREFWLENFSRRAFIRRIRDALDQIESQ